MKKRGFSFEFFPPRTTEQKVALDATQEKLRPLKPLFFSVTFGAGGSTLDATRETVLAMQDHGSPTVVPHLSCMGGTPESIRKLLQTYRDAGISHVLALRGDVPSGMGSVGYFRHANELIEFIRAEFGDAFHITAAAYPEVHPESESRASDLKYLKRKVDAGVDQLITQFFFNADAYFQFVDDARAVGIEAPIIPGIMPITNYSNIKRFCDFCGTDMPRWLQYKLRDFGDDRKAIADFGTEFTTHLSQRLLDGGAPSIHFYTLNRSRATLNIVSNLTL